MAKKIWSSYWDTTSNLSKLASCLPFSPIKKKGCVLDSCLGGECWGFSNIFRLGLCVYSGRFFNWFSEYRWGNTPRMFTYHVSSSFVGCNGQVFGLLAVFFPERRAGTRSKHHRIPKWSMEKQSMTSDAVLMIWGYTNNRQIFRISTSSLNMFQAFGFSTPQGLGSLLPNVIPTEKTSTQCCLLPKHHAVTACRMLSAPWPQDIFLIVCWVVWEGFFLDKRIHNLCARRRKLAGWLEISLFH